jgi:hypothetical protein
MNTQKNAYEIRLEILKMANEAQFGKYYQKLESERSTVDSSGELTPKIVSIERINELFPKNSDILAHAEELYKFVCQN